MPKNHKKLFIRLLASVSMLSLGLGAQAQDQDTGSETITEVVVTGVAKGTNRLNTSISVSNVDIDTLAKFAPRSAAEVFRNVPGVRSESSGGEGNANIAVRGLPVAAGGAKFLQIHEDGLPVMEFGDIAFANSDIFLRTDLGLARIESVRGGTASTLASNSPGGIINLISNTGTREGGSVSLQQGLDFGQSRADFSYGGRLNENTRFHVGGFYRQGSGPRDPGYTANKGGQIKANITRELDNGFITLGVKYLNDRSIGYLPMPMMVTGSNSNPKWGSVPGLNARSQTIHSAYFLTDAGLDGQNNRKVTDIRDGMHPDSLVFNGEMQFELDGGWRLNNKFRIAKTKGNFASLFPATVDTAANIASGAGATALRIAQGPGANSAYTGLAMRVHTFNTHLNNLDNAANDLKLSKSFESSGVSYDLTFGLYNSSQNINMDWVWNTYLMEVSGNNARLLDAYNGATKLTQNGLLAYGVPAWGNCCTRNYNTQYDITAPYAVLAATAGQWTWEGSVRFDNGKATGTYAGSVQRPNVDVNGDGIIQPTEVSVSYVDYANQSIVNYEWDYTSYSLGATYRLADNYSAFGRVSKGARANADRLLFGKIRADGSVAEEDAVDFVTQIEGGIKYRSGGKSLFVTAFMAETEEQNFEATTQRFIDRLYEAKGVEIEGSYRMGSFAVNGGLTYTDAEITKDALNPSQVGNRPRRQANWVYQVTPSWKNDSFEIGANIVGTTDSYASDDNQLVMPGYAQVNLFASYDIQENLSVSLNVNNAFDAFGVTESEEGAIPTNGLVRARAINGRTSTVTLKYSF